MKPRYYDVAVIGNIGIDTNIYLPGAEIDFNVEANFTQNIDYIGQAGGYASRAYARLVRRVTFLGYVGIDYQGQYIRKQLKKDGIDLGGLWTDPVGTSRSVNFMYPDGRRKNFYDGKSHMTLQPDLELCQELLKNSRLAHFNIPHWARLLLPLARQNKTIIACDIQDVTDPRDPYRQDFIRHADYLFFSSVNHPDPAALMREFWHINPGCVILSGMGARGCALGQKGKVEYLPAPNLPLPVIDTNGAGDSLAAGFLISHIFDGHPLAEAARRGQIAARFTCAQKASTDTLINRTTLEQLAKG
jgi:sugar/nucleoside kinase (ribokinase family)